jgi:hypothetical protein
VLSLTATVQKKTTGRLTVSLYRLVGKKRSLVSARKTGFKARKLEARARTYRVRLMGLARGHYLARVHVDCTGGWKVQTVTRAVRGR